MTTNTINTTYDDLVRLNNEKATTLIPLMVFFGILMIFGLIGNSLVCFIMGFRFQASNQNLLIVSLAIFDLINCLLAMPKGILEMRFMYTFPSDALCKFLRFVAAFTCIGSVLVLAVIAIDRYKKICKPLSPQLTQNQTRIALAVTLIVTVFMSVPTFFIYGIRTYESPVKGQMAHDCFTSDDMVNTSIPIVYTLCLFIIFIVICVTVTVIYSCILFSLKQHSLKMSTMNMSVVTLIRAKISTLKSITTPGIRAMEIAVMKRSRKRKSKARADEGQSSTEKERDNTSTNLHPSQLQGEDNQNENQEEGMHGTRLNKPNEENEGETEENKNTVTSHKKHMNRDETYALREGKSEIKNLKDVSNTISNFEKSHFDGISEDGHSEKGSEDDSQSYASDAAQTTVSYQSVMSRGQCPFMISTEVFLNEQCHPFESSSNISFASTTDISNCGDSEETNKAERRSPKPGRNANFGTNCQYSREDDADTRTIETDRNKDAKLTNRKPLAPKKKNKATRIAFLVTLVFILSFLPHLTLRACKNIFKGFDYNLEGAPLISYNLFLRSYYINSIANPIIYGVLNIRFRAEVKVLYSKLFCFR